MNRRQILLAASSLEAHTTTSSAESQQADLV
jgi:hypothetical protein